MVGVSDAIDAYVAALRERLAARGVDRDRVTDEVEGHLQDIQDELVAGGSTAGAAARQAVARFGDAHVIAGAFPPRRAPRWVMTAHWVIAGLTVVGAGAMLEAVAAEGHSGPSLWLRFLAGLLGLALAEGLLLRSDAMAPSCRGARAITIALAVVGGACLAAGLTGPGGATWLGTAAAASAAAAALAGAQRGHFSRYASMRNSKG